MNQSADSRERDAKFEAILWRVAWILLGTIVIAIASDLVRRYNLARYSEPGDFQHAYLIEIAKHRALWTGIAALGLFLALTRRFPALVIGVTTCIVIEFTTYIWLHKYVTGVSFSPPTAVTAGRFAPHPLLQGVPNPGIYGRFTHEAGRIRRTQNEGKRDNPKKVYAFGGSTTYDVGVADADTWASHLSRLLGPNYLVQNHGVPGYSTVEHIIQASFVLRDDPPACVIYYIGWNDLRSSNTADLRPDYSNYHLLTQKANLGLTRSESRIAKRSAFISAIDLGTTTARPQPVGHTSSDYDERLARIFKENVLLLAAISRHFGVKPIFVPQILNYHRLKSKSSGYGWLPFVVDADVQHLMARLNMDLAAAAATAAAVVLDGPLAVEWLDSDFVDNGHFGAKGTRKFAEAIAAGVARECK